MVSNETTGTVDEEFIRRVVARILSVASPAKIILFGSAAAGQMTADSDVDLLIVEEGPIDRRAEYVRIRQALRGMGRPFDILFITTDWFEASKNVIGGIAYPAHHHGKVIYDAA